LRLWRRYGRIKRVYSNWRIFIYRGEADEFSWVS